MNRTTVPPRMPDLVAGADGCRGGWVVVVQNVDTCGIHWETVRSLDEFLGRPGVPAIVAVDIPIGLPERGARGCDLEARQLLKRPRASSVFPAPPRSVLTADSYRSACQRRFYAEGKRLSVQTWGIVPKIREVDQLLRSRPELRTVMRESHPELCFYAMADGKAMVHGKKSPEGLRERERLLRREFGACVTDALADRGRLKCGADDILDAFAVLWTARRIYEKRAISIPSNPERDPLGLAMEIVT